jgi:uroporphyrinogen decarboxylase
MKNLSAVKFEPNYRNMVDTAKNIAAERVCLYEHGVSLDVIEKITGNDISRLYETADVDELRHLMTCYNDFWKQMGYDTVTWELGITSIMPGNGALGAHLPGAIKTRKDFDKYPWDTLEQRYFDKWSTHYEILRETMPGGMKAFAGPGNGVFECVQDVVGYEHLCLLTIDDPDLYDELFKAAGDVAVAIWKRFLEQYGDIYAVCRFGDDLGYKSSTMLPPNDIKVKIIPQYKRVVDLVHQAGKPFVLHSCGCLFEVMDDIIDVAGIDGKHSNEDAIAPFSVWLEKYGDRISNYGGIDMDVLGQRTPEEIKAYTLNVLEYSQGHGGVAYGSGNSIPDYIPVEGYLAMVNTIREYRGDFK